MKFYIILLLMSFFSLVELNAQVYYLEDINFEVSDSNTVSGSLNPILIGGQAVGGIAAGLGFSIPFYRSQPIYAAVAWLAGSSLGVFLVGNTGDQKSSYWGTLLGGVAGSTIILAEITIAKSIEDFLLRF